MRRLIECVGCKTAAGLFHRLGWWQTAARVYHPTPTLRARRNPQRGFTLIELVMVIALAGAVAVMISSALSRPLEGFIAQSRRAELVDLAAGALNRMARDIRLAVPNSVHLNGANSAIEMFNVLDAGRYRPNRLGGDGLMFAPGTAAGCTANFAAVTPGQGDCSAFQVLAPTLTVAGTRWLVLYNIGAESGGVPLPGANVWAAADSVSGRHVITPDGTGFASAALAGSESLLTVTPPGGSFSFAYASPQRRFYLSDQIVGYSCAGGQLLRFTRSARLPAFAGTNAAAEALQATHVTACSMSYQPGSSQRAGLVTLGLTLTLAGESIQLFQQVHVDNAP